eukprot:EST49209.1 Protein phosphatase 2C [Spironucleus salmonicida]
MNKSISGNSSKKYSSCLFDPIFSETATVTMNEQIEGQSFQIQKCQTSTLQHGLCSIIGRRPTNEDRELIIQNVQFKIFAIFDGHGGDQASAYCYANFQSIFQSQIQEKNPELALIETCLILDNQFSKLIRFTSVGTTANIVLFYQNDIYYCNVGDSRCVVAYNNKLFGSVDHTPSYDRQRLTKLGVRVINCMGVDRVDGNLALARAIGDQYMAHQGIIAQGDAGKICIINEMDFCIVACDGLYGIFTNQQVSDIIQSCLQGSPVTGTAQRILLEASIAYFQGDNMKGDLLLGKVVSQRVYKTRVCNDVDPQASQATKLAQILCKLSYWKNSMDNVSVIVILK